MQAPKNDSEWLKLRKPDVTEDDIYNFVERVGIMVESGCYEDLARDLVFVGYFDEKCVIDHKLR